MSKKVNWVKTIFERGSAHGKFLQNGIRAEKIPNIKSLVFVAETCLGYELTSIFRGLPKFYNFVCLFAILKGIFAIENFETAKKTIFFNFFQFFKIGQFLTRAKTVQKFLPTSKIFFPGETALVCIKINFFWNFLIFDT